jgi:hypothetical protein
MLANTLISTKGDIPDRLTLPLKVEISLIHTLNLTFYTSSALKPYLGLYYTNNILVHFQHGNDSSHLYFFALQRSTRPCYTTLFHCRKLLAQ